MRGIYNHQPKKKIILNTGLSVCRNYIAFSRGIGVYINLPLSLLPLANLLLLCTSHIYGVVPIGKAMDIEYRGAGRLGSRLSCIKYLGITVVLLCQVPTNYTRSSMSLLLYGILQVQSPSQLSLNPSPVKRPLPKFLDDSKIPHFNLTTGNLGLIEETISDLTFDWLVRNRQRNVFIGSNNP